jgi:hypothetical protein
MDLYKSPQQPPHLEDESNTVSLLEPSPDYHQDVEDSTFRSPQTKLTMKLSLAAFAVAMLAEAAVAANCKGGLDYCGRTLNRIGTDSPDHQMAYDAVR